MHRQKMTDREVYPTVWITLAVLGSGVLFWRYALGKPTISACWFYSNFHVYCPGCGGTRALIALLHGQFLRSLYYHPAVIFTAVSVIAYLLTQTIWRLRGRRGWTLHYGDQWLWCFGVILLINCILRNLLWFCFQIPL